MAVADVHGVTIVVDWRFRMRKMPVLVEVLQSLFFNLPPLSAPFCQARFCIGQIGYCKPLHIVVDLSWYSTEEEVSLSGRKLIRVAHSDVHNGVQS